MKKKIISIVLALALFFAMASPVCAEGTEYTITVVCGNQEYVFSAIGQTPITEATTLGDIKGEFMEFVKDEVIYKNEDLQFWYGGPLIDETASLGDYNIPNGAKLKLMNVGAEITVNANMKLRAVKKDVYKVDITWGSMEFTYEPKYVWDPTMHTMDIDHEQEKWVCEEGADEITVTNHSSAAVNIGFEYTANDDSVVNGTISVDGNNTAQTSANATLEAASEYTTPSLKATVKLDGMLSSETTEKQVLGHVIITVSSHY